MFNPSPHLRLNLSLVTRLVWVGLLIAGVSSPVSAGESILDESSFVLSEVTVTATKTERTLMELPSSVSIVGAEEIRARQASTVGELLQNVPGVSMGRDGMWGTVPVIRGMSRERVLVLIDGVRVHATHPMGSITSLVDPDHIERIEVVRTPGSVLHGTDASGGVINIITRRVHDRPEEGSTTSGSVGVRYGNVNDALRGHLHLSRATPDSDLAVSMAFTDADGYRVGKGGELDPRYYDGRRLPNSAYQDYSFSSTVGWDLPKDRRLELSMQEYRGQDIGISFPPPGINARTSVMPRQDRSLYALQFEEFDERTGLCTLRTRISQQSVNRVFWQERAAQPVRNTIEFGGTTWSFSAETERRTGANRTLKLGVEYFDFETDGPTYLRQSGATPPQDLAPFKDGTITSSGLFAEKEIDLTDRWQLRPGLRFDRIEGRARPFAEHLERPEVTERRRDDNLGYSMGLRYRADDATSLFLAGGRSFRSPDMRERFTFLPNPATGTFTMGNPDAKSERLHHVELGIKRETARTATELTFYRHRFQDYITELPTGDSLIPPGSPPSSDPLPISQVTNIDRVIVRGVEFAWQWRISPMWTSFGTVAHTHGRDEVANQPLLRIAPRSASLGLRVQRPGSDRRGEVILRAADTQDRPGAGEKRTGGWGTLDLAYHDRIAGQTYLSFGFDNLFDRRFRNHLSHPESFEPGRSMKLSITRRF